MNSLIVLIDSTFAPVAYMPVVNTATGVLTNQRRYQERGRTAYVAPPVSVIVPPPVVPPLIVATGGAAGLMRRPRRRRIVAYVSPPVLVLASTFVAPPVAVVTPFDRGRRRRRPLSTALAPPIIPTASTFVAPPVDVTTVALRPRHRTTTAYIAPPTRVIGATTFIAVPTVAVPPFDHGRRRRRPLSTNLFPPIIPAAGFVAPPIDVTTVAAAARLRYRIVRGRRALGGGLINGLPAPRVTTVRTWLALGNRLSRVRRAPHSFLGAPAAASTFIAAPTVATPPFDHGRRRRRPLSTALAPPTVLQTFAGPVVKLQAIQTRVGRQRRRLPSSFLQPPFFYPATSGITVAIVRTRPRPTRHALTAVSYPATSVITVALAGGTRQADRRRGTRAVLAPPTKLQTFAGPKVALARIRPRKTLAQLGALIFYRQSSEITVTTVRTRPRRTRWFLTAVSYPQVTPVAESQVAVKTVQDDRRRRGVRSTLSPPIFYPQTTEVTVAIVRTRRVQTHSALPTVIVAAATATFPAPTVALARIRPRRTHASLTEIVYPATSEIAVATTRTRPRRTRWFLTAVSYPATSTITAKLVAVRPRRTHSILTAVSYPATSAIRVANVRTRPRRTHSFLTAVSYPQATPIVEVEVFVKTVVDDRRRRGTRSFITNVSYPATSAVRVLAVRIRPRRTRSFLTAISYPATSQIQTRIVRTRPRPTRHSLTAVSYPQATPVAETQVFVKTVIDDRRRRAPRSFLTAVTYPATSVIAVRVVRIRPRRTRSFLTAVSYPATSQIATRIVRIRPRPTRHSLTSITYPQVTPVAEAQVAAKTVVDDRRRRATRWFLTNVSYPATSTITTRLVATRPRRTRSFLTSISYPQTTAVRVSAVRIRPRGTRSFLTSITYSVTAAFVGPPIDVTTVAAAARLRYRLVRGRAALGGGIINGLPAPDVTTVRTWLALGNRATRVRRAPHSYLRKPVVVTAATFTTPLIVKTVRVRPRPTRALLAPPTALQVFRGPVEAEIFVKTAIDDRRRRAAHSFTVEPVTYPQTSEIAVTAVRIRPRRTRSFLTSISYPATSSIRTRLVRIRPRRTRYSLTAISYPATSVIVTKIVRARPRPTSSSLAAPTVLKTFPGPSVAETRIRPRRIRSTVFPPTVVRVPSVEQLEQTVKVSIVRTRPRPTRKKLAPPTVIITNPPVVTTLTVALVAVPTRAGYRRHVVDHVLSPPAAVIPLPTLRMQTVATALVRTRPRPVHARLTAVTYAATSVVRTRLVATRPRPTLSVLAAPTTLQTFGPPVEVEVVVKTVVDDRRRRAPRSFAIRPAAFPQAVAARVTLVRTRPRRTRWFLTAVSYRAVSKIQTHLVRIRPRPTSKHLGAPTVLRTFPGPAVTTVRARPRRTLHLAVKPVVSAQTSEITVTAVRIRPRPTTNRLAPPAITVTAATFAGPRVTLARAARGHARSALFPPAVVAAPAAPYLDTILVSLAPPRRPTVHARLTAPLIVGALTRPGFTTGYDVPGATIEGGSVAAASSSGTSSKRGGSDGAPSAVSESTGEDIATFGTTGHDERSGS